MRDSQEVRRSRKLWGLALNEGECIGPHRRQAEDEHGVIWGGVTEPLTRLLSGFNQVALERMVQAGVDHTAARTLVSDEVALHNPAMPIQDAIDLVRFLAEVTCGYMRFREGDATVAGPIDLATITYHEGFRWILRKHYYSGELNPPLSPWEVKNG